MSKPAKTAELKNMEIGEISVVDKAANKRKAILIKSTDGGGNVGTNTKKAEGDQGAAGAAAGADGAAAAVPSGMVLNPLVKVGLSGVLTVAQEKLADLLQKAADAKTDDTAEKTVPGDLGSAFESLMSLFEDFLKQYKVAKRGRLIPREVVNGIRDGLKRRAQLDRELQDLVGMLQDDGSPEAAAAVAAAVAASNAAATGAGGPGGASATGTGSSSASSASTDAGTGTGGSSGGGSADGGGVSGASAGAAAGGAGDPASTEKAIAAAVSKAMDSKAAELQKAADAQIADLKKKAEADVESLREQIRKGNEELERLRKSGGESRALGGDGSAGAGGAGGGDKPFDWSAVRGAPGGVNGWRRSKEGGG